MKTSRKSSVFVFLISMLFLMLVACNFSSLRGSSEDFVDGLTSFQEAMSDGSALDAKAVNLTTYYAELTDLQSYMDKNKARKKSRIEINWDPNKLSNSFKDLEAFIFIYKVPAASDATGITSTIPWRTEVAPSAKQFITDYKFKQLTHIEINIYARRKDGKAPNVNDRREGKFVDKRAGKEAIIDRSDPDDSKLWYLGQVSATTINSKGSNILGNYGYDARKGGREYTPDALVNNGWLDMIALFQADADAVDVQPGLDQDNVHEVITRDYSESMTITSKESNSWDLTYFYGGDGGSGKGLQKFMLNHAFTKKEDKDAKELYQLRDSTGKNVTGSVYLPAVKDQDVCSIKSGSAQEELLKAACMLCASARNSLLKMAAESEGESSTSALTKMGSTVAGRVTSYVYMNTETINPEFWSLDKIRPYLVSSFYEDVNNPDVPPEKLFDKYGTHMPFQINMGGKMMLSYTATDFSESSSESVNSWQQTVTGAPSLTQTNSGASADNPTSISQSSATLDVHIWGGMGGNTLVQSLDEYGKVREKWFDSLKYNEEKPGSNNVVFANAPYLIEGTGPGKMAGIWNFAEDPQRANELFVAFVRYLTESGFDATGMVYNRPKYLMDLVIFKPETTRKTYHAISDEVIEKLIDGYWRDDDYTGPYLYDDDDGLISDDYTLSKVFVDNTTMTPIELGKDSGIYGFGVYGVQKYKALRGIAITESTDGSDFDVHAGLLISGYNLPEIDSTGKSGRPHSVKDSEKKAVIVMDRYNNFVAEWRMCDCDGYKSDYGIRIWKSRQASGKQGESLPESGLQSVITTVSNSDDITSHANVLVSKFGFPHMTQSSSYDYSDLDADEKKITVRDRYGNAIDAWQMVEKDYYDDSSNVRVWKSAVKGATYGTSDYRNIAFTNVGNTGYAANVTDLVSKYFKLNSEIHLPSLEEAKKTITVNGGYGNTTHYIDNPRSLIDTYHVSPAEGISNLTWAKYSNEAWYETNSDKLTIYALVPNTSGGEFEKTDFSSTGVYSKYLSKNFSFLYDDWYQYSPGNYDCNNRVTWIRGYKDSDEGKRREAFAKLRGVAFTTSESSGFSNHASALITDYGLPAVGTKGCGRDYSVIDEDSQSVIIKDRRDIAIASWSMFDANKYGLSSTVKFWKSRDEKICDTEAQYPITDINLCFEKGSERAGWEDLKKKTGKKVPLEYFNKVMVDEVEQVVLDKVDVAIRREKVTE